MSFYNASGEGSFWRDPLMEEITTMTGEGLPAGGTTGQVLVKASNADGDVMWVDMGVEWGAISGFLADQVDLMAALGAKSDTGHSHSGLVPTGGTAGQVLKKSTGTNYDYTWGTDNTGGTPSWGSITGTLSSQADLNTALNSKAASTHTHPESDVTNLVSDLAGKAPTTHTHAQADVTGLTTALAGKSDTSHTHNGLAPTGGTTGQVLKKVDNTNYNYSWQADATGGAGSSTWGSITGTLSDQTDLDTALGGKAASTHSHAQSDVTNLTADLAAKAPTANPTFTGTVTVPTPSTADDTTKAVNSEWVRDALPVAGYKPYMRAVLTADLTATSNVTNTGLTELNNAANITAGKIYKFKYVIQYKTIVTTTGIVFQFNHPTGLNFLNGIARTLTAVSGAAAEFTFNVLPNNALIFTGTVTDDTTQVAFIEGVVKSISTDTLKLRFRSEVDTSLVTVMAGSFLELEEIA